MKRLLAFGAVALALAGAGMFAVSNAHAQTAIATEPTNTTKNDVPDTLTVSDKAGSLPIPATKDIPESGDIKD